MTCDKLCSPIHNAHRPVRYLAPDRISPPGLEYLIDVAGWGWTHPIDPSRRESELLKKGNHSTYPILTVQTACQLENNHLFLVQWAILSFKEDLLI